MPVRVLVLVLLGVLTMTTDDARAAQGGSVRKRPTAKTAPRKPASTTTTKPSTTAKPSTAAKPAAAATTREVPLMQCPSVLGNGAKTQRLFCDVLIGSYPAGGLRINIPDHEGAATLLFTLHNRQVIDEPSSGGGKPASAAAGAPAPAPTYARYTAALKVVKSDGGLLGDAIVQSEYRGPSDLVERIAGGAGPGGAKAVAPTGSESIVITVPPNVREVSLIGAQLKIERLGGTELINTPGRPIAVVSQVQVEYRPATSSAGR
jgi:hypothetical protein